MKITLYPGGSHNYEQVFLDCYLETVYTQTESGLRKTNETELSFTGRREGCFTDRVRIVTTVPYLIETEGK